MTEEKKPPPIPPCKCCGADDRQYIGGVCGRHNDPSDTHYWQSRCLTSESRLTGDLVHTQMKAERLERELEMLRGVVK